ncbi:LLM class flavin-dependent oxidoreductase [Pseudonocardia sp. RS11V-5]|uniref:LLM class flavin-dependent oxidoreductase n=1 Tax=Pseudonocardia terrae TaxID=2905831 RepID=UPI001E5FF7F7|nr:LLM class flavin-dependent oxidoreductase [Pseudonocardia terrae]MCE3552913.1 LLM class flavin-dependent oxidoreductase [Pseudonocardia terrae]
MRLGVVASPFYPSAVMDMILDGAHAIDADSLWVFDHMLGVFHPDLYRDIGFAEMAPDPDGIFDPFCACSWLGRRTELPLGVAVTDSIRRAAPDIARAALSLQHLCKGGFNLGVGSGEAENLVPFGYPFDHPVGRTENFLATLRHLLDVGHMPDNVGRLGLPLKSEAGSPRIWVAAHRPRMLRLTGEYADGWLPVDASTPEEYRELKATVAEHARKAGRSEPESGLFVFLVLGESRDRIRGMFEAQPMAKLFALWMAPAPAWEKYGLENPSGGSNRAYIDIIPHKLDPRKLREFAPQIPFELLEEYVFLGSPTEVSERLRGYAEAGLEHPILMNMTGLAGGAEEAMARTAELAELGRLIKTTAPVFKTPRIT